MEILKFSYEAVGPSITIAAEVDAVDAAGGTTFGPPRPAIHHTMEEFASLHPDLAAEFTAWLAKLEPVVRAKFVQDAADPLKVQAQAAQNARDRVAIGTARRLAEQEVAKAHQDRTEHEAAAAKAVNDKAATHAAIADLDAQLAARRKQLADLALGDDPKPTN